MKRPKIERIGVLTSGGDCPGLNAVIRGVVRAAHEQGWETYGFSDGYEGLLSPVRYRKLDPNGVDSIMPMGGTILGTVNRGRFAAKVGAGKKAEIPKAILSEARETFEGLGLGALVCIGGDGSLSTSLQLQKAGVPVVGVPKTIDNDLSATNMTFGFDSAVEIVVDSLDRLHTTARSHKRIMVVEVMGRHAGWIALHAGMAGGADVILIPELPFHLERIAAHILQRASNGLPHSLVGVAEGAHEIGREVMVKGTALGQSPQLGGIADHLAGRLQELTGRESRSIVLGHLQRGGSPSAQDRLISLRFGAAAIRSIADGDLNRMIVMRENRIIRIPLEEVADRTKTVPLDGDTLLTAREIGIELGA
ncbi:MAG: 6-phosphofructokinase [Chthoniobacterales bacterium]